jgi:modulator of FtsH protease HflK
MVQQAEGYKAQRVIRAQGDANRFRAVLTEYEKAPAVTRDRLYIESMERVMPTMEKFILDQDGKSGVLPLLPLRGMPNATAITESEKVVPTTEKRG